MKEDLNKSKEMTKSQKIYTGIIGLLIGLPVLHYMYFSFQHPNMNEFNVFINNPINFVFVLIGCIILKKKLMNAS
jgi:hypothetical protein